MDSRNCTEEVSVATEPKGNGVKTLGIKLPPGLHAQFVLVAQLDELSLNDAALKAVELYVETKQSAPDFQARAAAVLEEIEREATARRDAIQALFGAEAPDSTEQVKGTGKRGEGARQRP